jgi:hypothetical protein
MFKNCPKTGGTCVVWRHLASSNGMVHGEAYLLHVAAPVGPGEQLLELAARQGQLWQLKDILSKKQQNTYLLFL